MNYRFHREALRELEEAAHIQEEGLGGRFWEVVNSAIARVCRAPERYPRLDATFRRCLMTPAFPFALIYAVEPDAVYIMAVMHCSRAPGYWTERV